MGILANKTPGKTDTPVGVLASVNLSKVKSICYSGVTAATKRVSELKEGGESEAVHVDAMQTELQRMKSPFAKSIVDWGKMP